MLGRLTGLGVSIERASPVVPARLGVLVHVPRYRAFYHPPVSGGDEWLSTVFVGDVRALVLDPVVEQVGERLRDGDVALGRPFVLERGPGVGSVLKPEGPLGRIVIIEIERPDGTTAGHRIPHHRQRHVWSTGVVKHIEILQHRLSSLRVEVLAPNGIPIGDGWQLDALGEAALDGLNTLTPPHKHADRVHHRYLP